MGISDIGVKDEIRRIEEAIVKFGSRPTPNIAVTAIPYTGKTPLVDALYLKFPMMSARIKVPLEKEIAKTSSEHMKYFRKRPFSLMIFICCTGAE